jgi:catechol 2,3-dioxygenase-like lactoylglutathione lyase family enzyme
VTRRAAATLVVRDDDRAIAFFTGALGFRLVEDAPLPGGRRWVTVEPPRGGARLLLARVADVAQAERVGDQTGGRVAFFLKTDDLDRDRAAFLARGVAFEEAPRDEAYGRVCVFRDGEGDRRDLIEPARRPAANAAAAAP